MSETNPEPKIDIDSLVNDINKSTTALWHGTLKRLWEMKGLVSPQLYISEDRNTHIYFDSFSSPRTTLLARVIVNEVYQDDTDDVLNITDYVCGPRGGISVQRTQARPKAEDQMHAEHDEAEISLLTEGWELGKVIPGTRWNVGLHSGPVLAYGDYELTVHSGYDYELNLRRFGSHRLMVDTALHADLQSVIGHALMLEHQDEVVATHRQSYDTRVSA